MPTGCDEHANRYAVYAVDSRQAIIALAGEPRFLSIAPDMGLADLEASDDRTYPDVKALAVAYARNTTLSGIEASQPAVDWIAFLTVTSAWIKPTFVENGIIREDDDGIITDYAESAGIWSYGVLNRSGRHPTYHKGCGSDPSGGQVANVESAAHHSSCID